MPCGRLNPRPRQASTCKTCLSGTFSAAGASVCASCSAGYYSTGNATACTICPAGNWSGSGALSCAPCSAGHYSETPGASSADSCQACTNGSFASAVGASSHLVCAWCLAGTYSPSGATACLQCSSGTYSNNAAGSCQGCPPFSDAPAGGSLQQCACRAGYLSNRTGGSLACQPCPVGTYSNKTNSSACASCPAGTYGNGSVATSIASGCRACAAGSYSTSSGSACAGCAAGTFTNTTGATACQPCGAGYWGVSGLTVCNACPPATYSTNLTASSQSTCLPCPAGTASTLYGLGGAAGCQACPNGQTSPGGVTVCSGCPANTFATPGVDGCTACPSNSTSPPMSSAMGCLCGAGFYQSFRARASGGATQYVTMSSGAILEQHTFLPSGTITIFLPTDINLVCDGAGVLQLYLWPAGTFNVPSDFLAGSATRACITSTVISYYVDGAWPASDSTTYFKCMPCAPGSYAGWVGADACQACSPGSYQPGLAASACLSCPPSTVSSFGQSQCTPCAPGTYRASAAGCVPCLSGQVSQTYGAMACSLCPPNTWSDSGASACQSCPTIWATSPGGTDASGCECIAGMYLDLSGDNVACLECDFGSFSDQGATACTACPPGTYGPDVVASACSQCPPGQFETGYGSTACQDCPLGQQASLDSTRCSPCPPGFYCLPNGTVAACPIGTFSNSSGIWSLEQCAPCPANYICTEPTSKRACPEHTWSPEGSTEMDECMCEPGYSCSYTNVMDASFNLPMTEAQFQAVEQQFIDAIAEAAGVTPDRVTITGVFPGTIPTRRSLLPTFIRAVAVQVRVLTARSLSGLEACLRRHGLPLPGKKPSMQRGRAVRVLKNVLL